MNLERIEKSIKSLKSRMRDPKLRDGLCKMMVCDKKECGGCAEMESVFRWALEMMRDYYSEFYIEVVKARKEVAK